MVYRRFDAVVPPTMSWIEVLACLLEMISFDGCVKVLKEITLVCFFEGTNFGDTFSGCGFNWCRLSVKCVYGNR